MRLATGIALAIIAMVTVGCKPSQRAVRANMAYHYMDDPTVLQPKYKVFHQSNGRTRFYIQVNSSQILYSKSNISREFQSKMIFQINIYEGDNINKLVMADTIFLTDKGGSDEHKLLEGWIEAELAHGLNYLAEVTFDDQYRMQFVQDLIAIDKTDALGEQNFLVRNEKGEIQFVNYFPSGSKLKVEYNASLGSDIDMHFFEMKGKLPAPPFAEENIPGIDFESDSAFIFPVSEGKHFEVVLNNEGLYHFQPDIDSRSGLTLISSNEYFPYIKSVKQMLEPLRYITTRQEYDNFTADSDLKKNIDEFWFNTAGNTERAKELINSFYTRVEKSNIYFTSHQAGWKTDRGLIYIIYGVPNSVYKNPQSETWIYNEKNNIMAVEFTFYRVENPFTENDFYLSRSSGFKSSWYRAIDSWRQGRVF